MPEIVYIVLYVLVVVIAILVMVALNRHDKRLAATWELKHEGVLVSAEEDRQQTAIDAMPFGMLWVPATGTSIWTKLTFDDDSVYFVPNFVPNPPIGKSIKLWCNGLDKYRLDPAN